MNLDTTLMLSDAANSHLLSNPVRLTVPVPLSSVHAYSTTTTVVLSWKLHRQQSLSMLNLYNAHTQATTHTFNISSSEVKSQYTVKSLLPGTRFSAKAAVTTFLKHLNITLKQRLCIDTETGTVQICVPDV